MAKIQQLSLQEIQKIAAGEVIDRPANIVKELLENALDAQATHIKVFIKDGGKKLIRVIDNGCGMSYEDALMCCVHHATSKIKSVDDLVTIQTFGFRGEALSSIVSVARVSLKTRVADEDCGTELIFENGTCVLDNKISLSRGTEILVEDLFCTVPARKKFLKSTETEWRQIAHLMAAYSLANRSIHFELYHNGVAVTNCPPVKLLKDRVTQLWDNSMSSNMLSVEEQNENNNIFLDGLVSNHQLSKYDRSYIFLFVNGRWVKNQHLSKSVVKSYAQVLAPGKFPVVIMLIQIDPLQVDINIHPRKEEVKFLHPQIVESVVCKAVQAALQRTLIQKKVEISSEQGDVNPINVTQFFSRDENVGMVTVPEFKHYKTVLNDGFNRAQVSNERQQVLIIPKKEEQASFGTIIGQYSLTYILIDHSDGLMIVDQHAAHERVLYERFAQQFDEVAVVNLIFPVTINVSVDDYQLLNEHKNIFASYGIALEPFGNNCFIISATPVHIQMLDFNDIVKQFVAHIHEYEDEAANFVVSLHEKLRALMACHAAVKAGDELSMTQMKEIMAQLCTTDNNLTCPHGRPTRWLISGDELEKKFKRDYRSKKREY